MLFSFPVPIHSSSSSSLINKIIPASFYRQAYADLPSLPMSSASLGPVLISILVLSFAMVILAKSLWKKKETHHPTLARIRDRFSKLNPSFATIPLFEGTEAYTEDKSSITLCLVDPDTKREYDMNTLLYVGLHELAHVITPESDNPDDEHGETFKINFTRLLKEGAAIGIYDPSKPIPSKYCHVSTR